MKFADGYDPVLDEGKVLRYPLSFLATKGDF